MFFRIISSLIFLIVIAFSNAITCNAEASKHLNICYDHWAPSTMFLSIKNDKRGFAIELFTMALIGTGIEVDTICRQVATDTGRSKNRRCECYMWCVYY